MTLLKAFVGTDYNLKIIGFSSVVGYQDRLKQYLKGKRHNIEFLGKKDFDEIVGYCRQHEHFLDVFHLNKKIKDRLSFMPAMQGKLISAVEFKYDRHLTDVILDTIESNLIDELNTPENHENLKLLRSYLHRRWADIKPFKMRHLSVIKAIGCCESNHRKYTYRVKGQGKYWSEDGAEGILRVLTCIKNNELEYWLSSEFAGGQLDIGDQEELKGAVLLYLKP